MVALCANHMGAAAKKFCPRCHATQNTSLQKGRERTIEETRETLELLSAATSRARERELQTASGLKNYPNNLWSTLNPHRDFPVGTLHWMYLGLVKHLVQLCVALLTENQQELFRAHLLSIDQSSFTVALKPDMAKNIGSRQGKDFKQFIQIAPFIFGFVGLKSELVVMVCSLARLCKLISTMPLDMPAIQTALDDYFELLQAEAPQLLKKVKTHLSTHIVDDIQEHGPPAAYAEDVFEKQHGVIRQCLFTQNQLARSRDTARRFAANTILNHVLAGGYIQDGCGWKQCGPELRLLGGRTEIRRFLGSTNDVMKGGALQKVLQRHPNGRPISTAFSTLDEDEQLQLMQACLDVGISPQLAETSSLTFFKAVRTTKTNRLANSDTPVLFLNSENEECSGIFLKGASIDINGVVTNFACIKPLVPSHVNVNNFGCKVVKTDSVIVYILAANIVSLLSLVHDCSGGECKMKRTVRSINIEQQRAEISQNVIQHNQSHNRYFLNEFRHC